MVCIMWLMKTTIKLTHCPLICLFYREQYTTTRLLILDSNVLPSTYLASSSFWFNLAIEKRLILKGPLQTQPPWLDLDKAHGQLARKQNTHTQKQENKTKQQKQKQLGVPLTKYKFITRKDCLHIEAWAVDYANIPATTIHLSKKKWCFQNYQVDVLFCLCPWLKQNKIWDMNGIAEYSHYFIDWLLEIKSQRWLNHHTSWK